MERRKVLFLLAVILAVTFIPWLGCTLFNTKGEPREAIVALSMIRSGNYVLPVSMGCDIAYKPPMLAWLIVGCSWLTGGVTEMASRLPSALAAIAMCLGVFAFYARRASIGVAACTALVTATSFEVFRAASACRVDMLLTAFVVGAILVMQSRWEQRGPSLSVAGVLLMSCAILTKGPVGVILPCLAVGVTALAGGRRFWPVCGWLALGAVLSLLLPALWYVAAAARGGDTFIQLALEENLGRFTGRMSYDSHVNPFYYNFITVIAGMLPYTLAALMALFAVKWRKPSLPRPADIRRLDPVRLFSLVTIVVIFVFYCIPKSKRSVYLLPIYPFMAYYVTLMLVWLVRRRSRVVSVYAAVMGGVAVMMVVAAMVLRALPQSVVASLGSSKPGHVNFAAEIAAIDPGFIGWVLMLLPLAGAAMIAAAMRRADFRVMAQSAVGTTVLIYWALSGLFMPAVLNPKSDLDTARAIEAIVPDGEPVYSFVTTPMLRFYTIGFYTGDRLRLWDTDGGSATMARQLDRPDAGYIIVGEKDMPEFEARWSGDYTFSRVLTATHRSYDTRDLPSLYRFTRKFTTF